MGLHVVAFGRVLFKHFTLTAARCAERVFHSVTATLVHFVGFAKGV
jgi:hypothetical protein